MRLGRWGELLPVRGFSRWKLRIEVPNCSAWKSHDDLFAISSLNHAPLPGTDPPELGPQWMISVSRSPDRSRTEDVQRVVDCFAMPAFDEDNHHPGIARHLWCPVDPAYQQACECHIREVNVVDGDYVWTTEPDDCRGCEYERLVGTPCPIHGRD